MKKLLTILALTSVLTLAARADDDTDKQTNHKQQTRKEMLDKYDTNKDGKLDKEERSKISPDDQAKMEKAGIGGKKKGDSAGEKQPQAK